MKGLEEGLIAKQRRICSVKMRHSFTEEAILKTIKRCLTENSSLYLKLHGLLVDIEKRESIDEKSACLIY